MAFDFNAAREIVEAAKKRGMIRTEGEEAPLPSPERKEREGGGTTLPDWLQDGLVRPPAPE